MLIIVKNNSKSSNIKKFHSWVITSSTALFQLVCIPGMTHTSMLTLEYMAPLRTSPLRIQIIEAAGLALSAWQVRLSGSPALRLTTGPPLMTGSSGGTIDQRQRQRKTGR